jgi:hypothetical protein
MLILPSMRVHLGPTAPHAIPSSAGHLLDSIFNTLNLEWKKAGVVYFMVVQPVVSVIRPRYINQTAMPVIEVALRAVKAVDTIKRKSTL